MKTYTERLGYFLDWCEPSGIKHLDQVTHGDDLLPYVSFLRQRKTTRDTLFEPRYVYNIFQTCNTFLRANAILFAGEILGQLDYEVSMGLPQQMIRLVYKRQWDLYLSKCIWWKVCLAMPQPARL